MSKPKKFEIKEVISINGIPYKGSMHLSDNIFTVDVSDIRGGRGSENFLLNYLSDMKLRNKRIQHNDLIDELLNTLLAERYLEVEDTFVYDAIIKILKKFDIEYGISYFKKPWELNDTYVIKLK